MYVTDTLYTLKCRYKIFILYLPFIWLLNCRCLVLIAVLRKKNKLVRIQPAFFKLTPQWEPQRSKWRFAL